MFCIIFGIVVEVKQKPAKDTLEKKDRLAGCVEVGVWADGQDDEQDFRHSDHVHGEEKPKYERLEFWLL